MTAACARGSRSAGVLACAVSALLGGCIEIEGREPPSLPTPREQVRTVEIELMRTVERRIEIDASGEASYAQPVPLGGVEVCVIAQREAFATLEPFEELTIPACVTNVLDETTRIPDLPAHSDLLITYQKQGFHSLLTTFRTDDHDVALPDWVGEEMYFVPLVPSAIELPLDAEAGTGDTRGRVAVWVEAVGEYTIGGGGPQFFSIGDGGVDPAEGVSITVEDPASTAAAAAAGPTAISRRDRPSFLSLPQGEHRVRFEHSALEVLPIGVQEQYMIVGLPTERYDTIEVPVREGFLTLAMGDGYCPLPPDPTVVFDDLETCTIDSSTSARDAGDAGAGDAGLP